MACGNQGGAQVQSLTTTSLTHFGPLKGGGGGTGYLGCRVLCTCLCETSSVTIVLCCHCVPHMVHIGMRAMAHYVYNTTAMVLCPNRWGVGALRPKITPFFEPLWCPGNIHTDAPRAANPQPEKGQSISPTGKGPVHIANRKGATPKCGCACGCP